MNACIDSDDASTDVPKLAANNGYWQVQIDVNEKNETISPSHHAIYHFIGVPFGLENGRNAFLRPVDVILDPGDTAVYFGISL